MNIVFHLRVEKEKKKIHRLEPCSISHLQIHTAFKSPGIRHGKAAERRNNTTWNPSQVSSHFNQDVLVLFTQHCHNLYFFSPSKISCIFDDLKALLLQYMKEKCDLSGYFVLSHSFSKSKKNKPSSKNVTYSQTVIYA